MKWIKDNNKLSNEKIEQNINRETKTLSIFSKYKDPIAVLMVQG